MYSYFSIQSLNSSKSSIIWFCFSLMVITSSANLITVLLFLRPLPVCQFLLPYCKMLKMLLRCRVCEIGPLPAVYSGGPCVQQCFAYPEFHLHQKDAGHLLKKIWQQPVPWPGQ